jgi:hypothetical protein
LAWAAVAALVSAEAAAAHHSPAAFDMTTEVVIEGTVAELAWKNPHVYLMIETEGPDGAPLLREVEADGPSYMATGGLTQDMFALGAQVRISASPSRRNPERLVRGRTVVFDDGAAYALTADGRDYLVPEATVPAEGLAGNWAPSFTAFTKAIEDLLVNQAWRFADPPAGQDPAAGLPPAPLCEPYPPPTLSFVPLLRTIEVSESAVVMRFDADGVEAVRTVHLDQAEHPADVEPSLYGHSIGWWEDRTLVVDTVGFSPNLLGIIVNVPNGPEKHLVERLTLTEDGLHLRYEITMEDPDRLAEPASYTMLWDHRPDLTPSEEPCDPEIARRSLEDVQ